MPKEDEIRELVRRVVDEVVDTPASEPTTPASEPVAPAVPVSGTHGSVALGADHGGYALKEKLVAYVRELGYQVEDCGTWSTESVDYPDFAHAVARRVASGACDWGIVVDGAGIGSSMAANKVPGVRASLCYDLSTARNARAHNHANVLTLGSGLTGENLARQIVREWLTAPGGPERHARRVAKMSAIEEEYLSSDPVGDA